MTLKIKTLKGSGSCAEYVQVTGADRRDPLGKKTAPFLVSSFRFADCSFIKSYILATLHKMQITILK